MLLTPLCFDLPVSLFVLLKINGLSFKRFSVRMMEDLPPLQEIY